uniref:Protein kinase domain-containing protein n=1 Tax=Salix viminalis TaxID=40686 RepID=A0A6N2LXL8_SALVM
MLEPEEERVMKMVLEEGIMKTKMIVEGNQEVKFTTEEYQRLHQCVFDLHSASYRNNSHWLLERFVKSLEESINSAVLPSFVDKHDALLLRELILMWSNYKLMTKWLCKFFESIDRHFVPKICYCSLTDISNNSFHDMVFKDFYVKFQDVALSLINQERMGLHIDCSSLKNVFLVFMEMHKHTGITYYEGFESVMLEQTSSYYCQMAQQWLSHGSPADYVQKVYWCLEQEAERAGRYFPSGTQPKLLKVVKQQLVYDILDKLVEKQRPENCSFATDFYQKVNRETAFIRNGSKLLEKLIDICDGKCNSMRRFSATELEKATNDYDPRKLLINDFGYKLYKETVKERAMRKREHGILVSQKKEMESQVASLEKEKDLLQKHLTEAEGKIDWLRTKMESADTKSDRALTLLRDTVSLLCESNSVKEDMIVTEKMLDGENEPYANWTLQDCLWGSEEARCRPLLWIVRSKIAMDMANAVAFLHAAFARPIVFRHIKPLNILLDDNHEAKLSDFSLSVSIPEGESHVRSATITGTAGLVAPEYFATGNFNEKQDVFNFGGFLLMLLSGQTMADYSRPVGELALQVRVKKCIEDDRLNEVIDSTIIAEGAWPGKQQQLQAFAAVALRCISEIEEDRPTMIDWILQSHLLISTPHFPGSNVNRDIKPSKIISDENYVPKLIDFSLSIATRKVWIKQLGLRDESQRKLPKKLNLKRSGVPGGWCARALYRIGGMTTCWETKKDKKVNKETVFIRNGSKLLEKLVDICDGKCNSIRRFSATELKKATNNYDPRKLLTEDSGYKLYKGFLQGRPVSVKKFKDDDEQYEYCFNDIVYSSKMSVHKSFVKLLGCCLETQIPILVFEYVGDRTLYDCLWGSEEVRCRPLLWIARSKIAMDMANAVAFLHAAFARPIVFRNIKSWNILLDDNHEAKLSDFSYSISIPEDDSHVRDVDIIGTLGLIAPEYLTTGNFNEKQDVFNFGVFLLVLLSGQRPYDSSRPTEEIFLLHHVKNCIEDDRLNKIIDSTIIAEGAWPGKEQQLQAFAALALKCISQKEEDRPSMIDENTSVCDFLPSAIRILPITSCNEYVISSCNKIYLELNLLTNNPGRIGGMTTCWGTKKDKKVNRETAFIRNGSILLEKLVDICDGKCNSIRRFSATELEKATNNYDPRKLLTDHLGYKLSKIAMDMANAVAFLHAAFPRPIVFRNITPSNILLDDNHEAKLSDFTLSISIPEGESHVRDGVIGTFGLVAPEYWTTCEFNEKQDVFNFGVFLLMLLSGQRQLDPSDPADGILRSCEKCVEDDRLNEVIDSIIIAEGAWPGKEQQLQAFAALALRCISDEPEDRPTMIDVSKELRKIHRIGGMTTCWETKKDKKVNKETAFIRNGSKLLEKLVDICDGKCNSIRRFSATELEKATNNYDPRKLLTDNFSYNLYKGFLQGRPVSVKKFRDGDERYEQCLNDIVYASKMSVHKSFVKLLGCCLETQIPILVFEYVGEWTLHDCLWGSEEARRRPLLWIPSAHKSFVKLLGCCLETQIPILVFEYVGDRTLRDCLWGSEEARCRPLLWIARIGGMTTCWETKKDKKVNKNGSKLLEKLVEICDGKCNSIRSFSATELKKATNNYDPRKQLTMDFGYKLYKGFLQGRPVFVKKFKDGDEEYEQCFNDIVYSSKMSVHKSFVKLLGCCLETQIPILVFEYVGDRTLGACLRGPEEARRRPLLWIARSKIAMDMANAVAFLHAAFARPIVFRNIKPRNILLDDNHEAKLSDFSYSVSIPEGESHVRSEPIIGTIGLMAPECFNTGNFNEKQDVFNFGVFLLMLLSGHSQYDPPHRVKKCIEDDRLNEAIDSTIIDEGAWPGKEQQLQAFAALALTCISEVAEDRPSMIDVSKELRKIHRSAISCRQQQG